MCISTLFIYLFCVSVLGSCFWKASSLSDSWHGSTCVGSIQPCPIPPIGSLILKKLKAFPLSPPLSEQKAFGTCNATIQWMWQIKRTRLVDGSFRHPRQPGSHLLNGVVALSLSRWFTNADNATLYVVFSPLVSIDWIGCHFSGYLILSSIIL